MRPAGLLRVLTLGFSILLSGCLPSLHRYSGEERMVWNNNVPPRVVERAIADHEHGPAIIEAILCTDHYRDEFMKTVAPAKHPATYAGWQHATALAIAAQDTLALNRILAKYYHPGLDATTQEADAGQLERAARKITGYDDQAKYPKVLCSMDGQRASVRIPDVQETGQAGWREVSLAKRDCGVFSCWLPLSEKWHPDQ